MRQDKKIALNPYLPMTVCIADGHIAQVEVTSCGLNGGPLQAHGSYPAAIVCVLTNGHMPHVTNGKLDNAEIFPKGVRTGCLRR